MREKGFETEITINKTPNFSEPGEKPLKPVNLKSKKVDINVLKARAQEIENKEHRKNIVIFVFFLTIIAGFGIFLSI